MFRPPSTNQNRQAMAAPVTRNPIQTPATMPKGEEKGMAAAAAMSSSSSVTPAPAAPVTSWSLPKLFASSETEVKASPAASARVASHSRELSRVPVSF